MTDLVRPPLDFIVTREDWCRYDLLDNAILKVKVVLTRVYKQQGQLYSDFQPIYAVLTNEREARTQIYYLYKSYNLQ